ncbi:MAG: hypothetical protein ACE5FF_11330, partial [Saprospiraceae bacterium]
RIDKRALVEASGGVALSNARAIAETGVDLISIGVLTHSAPAVDVSMRMTLSLAVPTICARSSRKIWMSFLPSLT